MNGIENILLIIDPTASEQPALPKTALLAKMFNASVEVLLCDNPATFQERMARGQHRDNSTPALDVKQWLEALAEGLRRQDITTSIATSFGDPLHEGLLRYFANSPADLVIKDTHHHSILRRTFLSNTDWHLIRGCPKPLLLTKPTRWHQPLHIGAAVDPGHPQDPANATDEAILRYADLFARASNSAFEVLHAYFPAMLASAFDPRFPMPALISNEVMDAERELHESMVSKLLDRKLSVGKRSIQMGVAAEYLPRTALEEQIDIMVMGGQSRSRLKQAVLGSTAERVLEHLPCDILSVKPVDWAACLPVC